MAKKANKKETHQPLRLPAYFFPILLIFLGWAILLIWKTTQQFPWRWEQISLVFQWDRFGAFQSSVFFTQWFTTFKHLALVVVFCLAAFGPGHFLKKKLIPQCETKLESLLFSLALGFMVLAFLIFLQGVMQLYYPWLTWVLLLVLAGWGGGTVCQQRNNLRPSKGWLLGSATWTDKFLVLCGAGFSILIMMMITVPEIFFDSLVYHLAVPNTWIQAHGIHGLPYNFFSNLPMMIEMLYTAALMVADERLCRMLHALLGFLGIVTTFAIGRRFYGRRAGLWAAGLLLTVPVLVMNMQTCGVDAGAAFFAAIGFLALWHSFEGKASPYLAGFLVGMALAVKYNTVLMLGPAALFLTWHAYREKMPTKELVRLIFKIGLVAFCILLPWFTKNTIQTGNPVAPFLFKHIPTQHLHPEKMQQQMDGFKEYGQRSLLQYFRQPWDLTFYQPTSNSYVGVVFLFLFPGLILMLVFFRRGPPIQWIMVLTCFAAAILWSFQTQITRYYIPALPLLTVLCAGVMQQWQNWQRVVGSFARLTTVVLVFWGLLCTAGITIPSWDPVGVFIGKMSPSTYLEQRLMNSYHRMARYVNQLPDPVKVLIVGETRAYYFKKPVTAASVYDYNPWIQWISQADSARAVWEKLREQGYTHVFIHSQEAVRTRGYEKYRWQATDLQKLAVLTSHYLDPIATERQQWLYKILDQPILDQPVKQGRPLYTYDFEVTKVIAQHNSRVYHFLQQGKTADARATWMRMIELAPDWPVPYTNLGWFFLQNNRPAEAFDMYQQADRLGWIDPGSYNNFGVQFMSMEKDAFAEKYFRLALKLNPDFALAQKNLEEVLLRNNE